MFIVHFAFIEISCVMDRFLSEEEIAKKMLMENLFLEACIPELRKMMDKMMHYCCSGCRDMQPNQMAHECLGYNAWVTSWDQYDMAAPRMPAKLPKILEQMKQLITEKEEYKELTLMDFLRFYNPPYQLDPLTRLCSDHGWRARMLEAISGPNPAFSPAPQEDSDLD